MDLKFEEIEIKSWNELKSMVEFYSPEKSLFNKFWIFRGQASYKWKLATTLERFDLAAEEDKIIEDFQKHSHLYIDTNKIDTSLEWLSVMQHHGTPTRLLDWTLSPYVAIFFAVNEVNVSEEGYSALHAINYYPINTKLKSLYEEHRIYDFLAKDEYLFKKRLNDEEFEKIFQSKYDSSSLEKNFPGMVLPLIPFNTHARLTIQQGLFLCPTQTVEMMTFEENLEATYSDIPNHEKWIRKYLIPNHLKPEIIAELNHMNINDATLFPGIDGYSKFLRKKYSLKNERLIARHLKLENEQS